MTIAELRLALAADFCFRTAVRLFEGSARPRDRLSSSGGGLWRPQAADDAPAAVMASPGAEPPRQVKVGSVIVREHKGVLHEVMVVPGGFCWRGQIYDSLSTIAKKITGVSWNGPRFFGLRSKRRERETPGRWLANHGAVANASQVDKGRGSTGKERSPRSGRRSSIRTGAAR